MSRADEPQIEQGELPPVAVRTWINLLLFVHLFMVTVAVTSYTSPSTLQQRLRTTLAPYLKTFNFDLSHGAYNSARLHLTHASEIDVDFKVTVNAPLPDGAQRMVTIPDDTLWPAQRYRRELALANTVGALAANQMVSDEMEGILPKAIAGAVLKQSGAPRDTIVVTGHTLPNFAALSSGVPEQRNPTSPMWYRKDFEAQVFLVNGEVNLLKTTAAGEVAPVEKGGPPR